MKNLINYLVVMLLLSTAAHSKTIYLIRHAEKVDDGSKDPVLTVQGQQRAHNIAAMLATAEIEHVYATDYQRTQLTAQPMAEYLGTEVRSYDPRKLADFAEQLKQQAGNALVVGHSNTTPMLTHLLSGQPVFSLDEDDFDNLFQVVMAGDYVSLNVLKSTPSFATQKLSEWTPIQERFFSGELVFNMLFNGDVVGQSKHVFAQQNQVYHLHEHTGIETMNIDADIKATVDAATLAPISLEMSGSMGAPVAIQLDWQGNHIKGFSQMAREPFKPQGKIAIDQTQRPRTLERTSAIMLAHMLPVSANTPLLINWFNGYDADQRLIQIKYHGEEQVTVPAGTFDTYKIEYSGGAPSQYYWIDKKQAKVVKIEVIKMPWRYELLSSQLNQ